MKGLSPHPNVRAALDHLAGSATMLVAIFFAMSVQIVDMNRTASLDRDPGVGAAAVRMDSGVGDAQSRFVIDENVRRSLRGGSGTGVRAVGLVMRVLRDVRVVAETGLRAHHLIRRVAQT